MKSIAYWMFFQMFIGCWLLISPFVMGYEAMKEVTAGNMLAGAVLVILGLSVIIHNAFDCEKYSHPDPSFWRDRLFKKI